MMMTYIWHFVWSTWVNFTIYTLMHTMISILHRFNFYHQGRNKNWQIYKNSASRRPIQKCTCIIQLLFNQQHYLHSPTHKCILLNLHSLTHKCILLNLHSLTHKCMLLNLHSPMHKCILLNLHSPTHKCILLNLHSPTHKCILR